MAVRLFHAPGGQGKTRLALQLAAAATDAGWVAWYAEPNASSASPAGHCPLPGSGRILVVADYVDRWPTDHLLALLDDLQAVRREANVVIRILMLARSARLWWPSIAERLSSRDDVPADAELLVPLDSQVDTIELFQTAATSFAERLDVDLPDRLEIPEHLASSSSVLAIHMAALTAVDAHRRTVPPPGSLHAVSAYLLRREHTHWRALHRRAEDGYGTNALTMRRIAYLATLLGSLPRTSARHALIAIGIAAGPVEADRIIDDHIICYPPAKRGEVLEPIHPDRLAEDLIALVTSSPEGDDETTWLSDDWTIDATIRLLTGDPRWASTALPPLIEAASRWPHLVSALVCPLLRRRPDVALAAGGPVLARITGLEGIDPAILLRVEQQLPETLDASLDVGVAALSIALYEYRLSVTPDPLKRAEVHYAHADRLARVVQYHEAITALDEAISIYMPIIAAGAELPVALGLQAALVARGKHLADVGRLDEAITATIEAATIIQQMTTVPELQDVASELMGMVHHNLGTYLHLTDRLEDARTQFERATAIRRQPNIFNRAEHGSKYLASSLMGLAATLYDIGNGERAAAVAEEALRIHRTLAETDPAAHASELATALNNVAAFAIDAVDTESADRNLRLLRESIEIARRLADLNPQAYRPLLAVACQNLGAALIHLDRLPEALEPAEEAVGTLRIAIESNPAGLRDQFCTSLRNLGILLSRLQLWDDACAAILESLPMLRHQAADQRVSRIKVLEESLNRLAAAMFILGRVDEAITAADEAIDLDLLLVEYDKAAHLPQLGENLLQIGMCLLQNDAYADAAVLFEEAAGIFRDIDADSASESDRLGMALSALASCLLEVGRPAEAVVLATEAAEIYRRLSEQDPAVYEPLLAETILECAKAGLATGRHLPAALGRAHATVRLCGAYSAERGDLTQLLLEALSVMADLLDALRRPGEAVDLRRQVSDVRARRASTISVYDPAVSMPAEEPPAANSPRAAALLDEGAEHYRRGDISGAFAAWFTVCVMRDPLWEPKAEYNLGVLYAEAGNPHDAELFFRRVADGSDPEVAPKAALRLAAILREAGDIDGARAAYRTGYCAAIKAGDQIVRTQSASFLSSLLENHGDLRPAAAVLQGAFRAGDSVAMQELSQMLLRHGEASAAIAALNHASNLGDSAAILALGLTLMQQGDVEGAAAAYQRAIQLSDHFYSSHALLNLGTILFEQNDLEGARELWQRCLETGQSHTAPLAAANLGTLLRLTGDAAGARAAWQYVIDNGEPDLVARVTNSISDLLEGEHSD